MEEFIVDGESLLKSRFKDEHWKIMQNICYRFLRKNYDDELFQIMFITFEKLHDDIKFIASKKLIEESELTLIPNLNLEIINKRRIGYIYKTLTRTCSKHLIGKSNTISEQTPLTCREMEEFIKLRKIKNLSDDEEIRFKYLMELKNSVKTVELVNNDEDEIDGYEIDIYDNKKDILKLAISDLTENEVSIIDKHYIKKLSDNEIAKSFGVTRSAIQNRRKKILAKMRETLLDLGIDKDILKEMN